MIRQGIRIPSPTHSLPRRKRVPVTAPLRVLCSRAPPTSEVLIPSTRSPAPIPSSRSSHSLTSTISSINTERGTHPDVRLTPPLGRQSDVGGGWKPDTIQQVDRRPVMTTLGSEHARCGLDPRINHRGSLSPPRDLTRAASPTRGSTSSSLTAVHSHHDRLRPAATIKRYDRTTKLKPPFINADLPPLTTSFADG